MQKICVIVANGDFATHEIPLNSIKNADFIVACDGACNKLCDMGYDFDVGIGDFDSIDKAKLKNKKLIHIKEQSTNDLCKAFLYVSNLGFDKITIIGATGLRDDHHLANIFYLEYFCDIAKTLQKPPLISIQSNFGEFFCYRGSFKINCKKTQQISLFCSDKKAIFSSKGLKWELDNFSFKYIFSGSLNEALGDSFCIQTSKDNKMIVFLNYI